MRRDEVAYQRQMEIQSAQSIRTRTFGGQLTSSAATPASNGASTSREQNNRTPDLGSLSINPPPSTNASSTPLSLQDQARQVQHDSVTARASAMLNNDQTKITDFRSRISSYRTSAITASQLIDTLLTIFDSSPSDLGTLIKELAALFDNEAKRTGLLQAWNDWRAINEDYPSLPGPSGGTSPATAGPGAAGRRILKLKSSTAQSSRSATNRQHSWGRAAPPSTQNTGPAPRVGAAVPWGSSAPPATRTATPPVTRRAVAPAPAASAEAFPALPAAVKPNTTIWGMHTGTVRWNDNRPSPANPWAGQAGTGEGSLEVDGDDKGEGASGGKKKGGRKKQTLYKFG